jgi:flagellar export protein FliJ
MARFVFELEAVLRQRLEAERSAQLAVSALERERLRIEEEIRAFHSEILHEKNELREQLASVKGGGSVIVDLRGVRFQAGASLRLVGMAQRAVLQLAGVHKRLDAARLVLLGATTRRKAVEMLKDRRLEHWRQEQKRVENAAADELNVMHAARTEAAA